MYLIIKQRPYGKVKYQNTKIEKERRNSFRKNKETSG
jgi:hypothetical protein